MFIVDEALATAHELYDAGHKTAAVKALRVAIVAAGTDVFWLREIRKHIRWMFPTV